MVKKSLWMIYVTTELIVIVGVMAVVLFPLLKLLVIPIIGIPLVIGCWFGFRQHN